MFSGLDYEKIKILQFKSLRKPIFVGASANVNLNLTASDTLTAMSDSAIRSAQAFTRTVSDTLATLSETANRLIANVGRAASDALSALSDVATRLTAYSLT